MPILEQVEINVANARKHFADLMDKIVDRQGEMETPDPSFVCRVNELYYAIEANEFMLINNVDIADDSTFLKVYNKLMVAMGIYASNYTKDISLIIPEYNA